MLDRAQAVLAFNGDQVQLPLRGKKHGKKRKAPEAATAPAVQQGPGKAAKQAKQRPGLKPAADGPAAAGPASQAAAGPASAARPDKAASAADGSVPKQPTGFLAALQAATRRARAAASAPAAPSGACTWPAGLPGDFLSMTVGCRKIWEFLLCY